MAHMCQGIDASCLRPPIVALVLKGREHWENVQKTLLQKPKRVAVTLKVLKYLKRLIQQELSWPEEKKLRIWTICCLMWNGSLRVHEILSKTKSDFDPLTTLCKDDLQIEDVSVGKAKKSIIRLHLKSPKERRIGTGVKLEIFENQTFCCPVRAWRKWMTRVTLEEDTPIFREGEDCFTGKDFNKILTKLTDPMTRNTDSLIRSHSFRQT